MRKRVISKTSLGTFKKVIVAEKLADAILIMQLVAFVVVFFDLPFRQVVGFLYLSFLPGYLVLKVIRIDNISTIERVIFSSGLSLAILMLVGLVANEVLPILNLSPLSTFSSMVIICVSTFLLYIASRLRSGSLPKPKTTIFKARTFFSAIPLLVGIPLMTIIGVELVITSGNNFILLFLVILSAAIVLCTFSQRIFPNQTYPIILLSISLFLLFSVSLVSKYVIGFDVNTEYYFANLTSITSVWNRAIPHEYNAMLSITILPVLFSNFLNLNLDWVFKIVYPLIFSLVPLSLFVTFKKVTGSARIAFLAAFFSISIDVFYFQMLGLARQMIAELFFALLILLIVQDNIDIFKRKWLFVIFSAALIVSHYGVSYIFMIYLLLTLVLSPLLKMGDKKDEKLVTVRTTMLYFLMAVMWYGFVSPSVLSALTDSGTHIYENILEQTASPGVVGLMPGFVSPLHEVSKYLFYAMQLAIIVGLAVYFFRYRKTKSATYISMAVISLFIIALSVLVPFFAATFTMPRIYHLTSFFLAPMLVTGLLILFGLPSKIKRLFSASRYNHPHLDGSGRKNIGLFLVSIVLVAFFLFQVGFIYEVAHDGPSSLSLSFNRLRTNPASALSIWSAYAPEQDVLGAKWLYAYLDNRSNVYSDRLSSSQVLTSYGMIPAASFRDYDHVLSNTTDIPEGAYIFLRKYNVVNLTMEGPLTGMFWDTTDILPFLNDCDKIYSNGGCEIYFVP